METKQKNDILLGICSDDIFIKPEGYITANLCFNLHENLYKKISQMNPCFNIYIDMSNTIYMDSTFLGLLIGLEKKIYNNFDKHLYIINPSSSAKKYFEHYTLTFFLKIKEKKIPDDIEFARFDDQVEKSDLEKLKLIFSSHQNLCSLNEENKKRFNNLQNFIENEIKKKLQ